MIEASKIERENHRYTLLMMSEMPIFLIMGFVFVPFITTSSIISFVIIYRPLQGFFNSVIFMSHIYNVYNLFRHGGMQWNDLLWWKESSLCCWFLTSMVLATIMKNWWCLKQQLTRNLEIYDETGRADDKVSWCWSSQVLKMILWWHHQQHGGHQQQASNPSPPLVGTKESFKEAIL